MEKQTIETDMYVQLVHLITLCDTYHHYLTLNQHKHAEQTATEIKTCLNTNYLQAQTWIETAPSFITQRYCDLLAQLTLQPLVLIDTGNAQAILNTWQKSIEALLALLANHSKS